MTRMTRYTGGRGGSLVPGDFFREFWPDNLFNDFMQPGWTRGMRADVKETEKEFLVDMDMPGIKKENISVEMDDGVLTVTAKQEDQVNEERENYIRRERRYGTMCRRFVFDNVDSENIGARYEEGVLKLTIPKKAEEKKTGTKIDVT